MPTNKEELRQKLHDKLKQHQMARNSYDAVAYQKEKVETALKRTKNKRKKRQMKKQLALIDEVQEIQANRDEQANFNDDFLD